MLDNRIVFGNFPPRYFRDHLFWATLIIVCVSRDKLIKLYNEVFGWCYCLDRVRCQSPVASRVSTFVAAYILLICAFFRANAAFRWVLDFFFI